MFEEQPEQEATFGKGELGSQDLIFGLTSTPTVSIAVTDSAGISVVESAYGDVGFENQPHVGYTLMEIRNLLESLNNKLDLLLTERETAEDEEIVELRNITNEEALEEIRNFLSNNSGDQSISTVLNSLRIDPKIINNAFDILVKSGEIKNL